MLNMLRTSRIDPKRSAYEQLHGKRYDWNANIMAPPGTRAVIYEDALSRASWGPRGLDAWYLKSTSMGTIKYYHAKTEHVCSARTRDHAAVAGRSIKAATVFK